ncbi:MAG TPA: hypothetical protein VGN05_06665 [Parvibaculum sp.]|jgi:hypothetical protein
MPVAHLVRFKTSKSTEIQTQLRAYVERELDRKPPKGFLSSRVLAATDNKSVAFYTEWTDGELLADTRDSAPWEACMDLNGVHADAVEETTYEIA